jgi:hypothetical protein
MKFDRSQMNVLNQRKVDAIVLGLSLRAFQDEIGVERTNKVIRPA